MNRVLLSGRRRTRIGVPFGSGGSSIRDVSQISLWKVRRAVHHTLKILRHLEVSRSLHETVPRPIITALIFLVAGAGALAKPAARQWMALGLLTGHHAGAALQAKDVDKAVAFCDEQGSMLWPNDLWSRLGKDAITKLTASAFAIPDFKLDMATRKSRRRAFRRFGLYERHIRMDFQGRVGKTRLQQKGSI